MSFQHTKTTPVKTLSNTIQTRNTGMARNWIPPNPGTLKINVHGISSSTVSFNGFINGIGAMYRNSDGDMKLLTLGVIPQLTTLGNQLWAIFVPLRRAFKMGYRDIVLETDNLEAFLTLKNFHIGAPAGVYHIISQIMIRIKDVRWFCSVHYIYPERNLVVRFLSNLGKRVCTGLYTLNRPIGRVEEYLEWDLGFGIEDPDYLDEVIPDPENFESAVLLSYREAELGLGQACDPRSLSLEVDMEAERNVVLDTDEEMMEEAFQGGIAAVDDYTFAGDAVSVSAA